MECINSASLSAATGVVKMRLGIKQHYFYTIVSSTGIDSV
jgi:hypothetical protein